MGLIKAAFGALGGTLADPNRQFKDNELLVVAGDSASIEKLTSK